MISPRTTRSKILTKLRAKTEARKPLLIASAGSGLVASLLEKAGADCVNTFSGARLRANGMGTMSMMWPILDSNQQVFDNTTQDILPAMTGDAFVCACINANDPLRDMRTYLQQLLDAGVPSVSNIGPSVSYVDKDSTLFQVLKKSGITFENEVEMLKLAKEEKDMVTVALAFDMEDAQKVLVGAKPDIFCFHAGTTKGGLVGFDSGESIEETAKRSEEAYTMARDIHPEVLLVGHGAAMETPEDAAYMLAHTSGHGIWTGSSTERLPIEKAVFEAASAFANLEFPS
ncbi:MAG: phosphoenolpyruvate hydrolase family protein [Planctomycetota bacterium]|nr:phosphoenolpyruvate hydrolase family protein [Planctomycetota bacterium]